MSKAMYIWRYLGEYHALENCPENTSLHSIYLLLFSVSCHPVDR